jgi:hypothetical protein
MCKKERCPCREDNRLGSPIDPAYHLYQDHYAHMVRLFGNQIHTPLTAVPAGSSGRVGGCDAYAYASNSIRFPRTSQQWRTASYVNERTGKIGGIGEWLSNRRAERVYLSLDTCHVLTWHTQPPLARLIHDFCACSALCRVKMLRERIRLCHAIFRLLCVVVWVCLRRWLSWGHEVV